MNPRRLRIYGLRVLPLCRFISAAFSPLMVRWARLPPSRYGLFGVALRRVAVTIGLCSVRLSEGSCPALPRRAARRRLSGVPCVLFPHRHPIVSIARTAPLGMRRGFRVLGVRLNLESARLVRARGVEPRLLPWRIGGAPIVSWPSARCRSP